MSQSVYHIPVKDIKGQDVDLDQYQGKVLLIVNVASKCGLTPQYEGLEKLYQAKKDQGLEILGFPANNFLEQEPGTNDEIEQFCSLNYDVHFPLFAKISVFSIPERKRGYRFIWYPPKNPVCSDTIYLSPISQLYISSYCFAE